MIITIGRQCGSDGYTVGEALAKKYHLPLYDKKTLITMAKEKGIYTKMPNFFAERPVNSLLYAIAEGEENTNLRKIPEEALRTLIGDASCILIGRCGNDVFKEREDACRVFLYAPKEHRINRMMAYHGINRRKAEAMVEETDENRKDFHEYYTGREWGKAEDYDMSLDSSKLGIIGVVEMIEHYIKLTKGTAM